LRRVFLEPVSAHYRLFTAAGRALWHGQQAYGTDHGTSVGLWLYSPSCGMFFFGPFSVFPDPIGMILYMVVSLALFGVGAWALLRALGARGQVVELFCAFCAAPLMSGILSTKLEIAMTGVLMLSAALLIRRRFEWAAGIAMAMILNWKLQPAPTILLWLLVLWRAGSLRRFGIGLAVGLVLSYGLPYAFLPVSYLAHEESVWRTTLSAFTRESLFHFENVFCFTKFAFGVETPWPVAQALSALAGLGLAGCLWAWMGRARGLGKDVFLGRGLLVASALGAAFAMAFSPLGQNNGLILTAPLLLWFSSLTLSALGCPREQVAFAVAVALSLIVPYSDLVPLSARDWLHALSIKQMLLLAATAFGVFLELRTVASRRRAL
jgi:hypothetical protein